MQEHKVHLDSDGEMAICLLFIAAVFVAWQLDDIGTAIEHVAEALRAIAGAM